MLSEELHVDFTWSHTYQSCAICIQPIPVTNIPLDCPNKISYTNVNGINVLLSV